FLSVLVFYDHLDTLPAEVRLIWGRKWTSVTMLFHLNRCMIFLWALEQLLTDILSVIWAGVFCRSSIGLAIETAVAFPALRIFAVSGRNWWLTLTVCSLDVTPVIGTLVRSMLRA
ncbi:hypothetical protein OBBRIDRAFT_723354, partial [Obba rivulosa]